MAEMASRTSPLAGRDAFRLHAAPARSRFVLRGDAAAVEAVGAVFGVAPTHETCRAAEAGERAALWLGPDEWLLLAAPDVAEALAERVAAAVPHPHSLVDVSHRQVGIAIEGPDAAERLAAGCPLDLDESRFPPGMCTRTLLGRCEIVLWRRGPESWHLEVARSFAPYAWDFLLEAA